MKFEHSNKFLLAMFLWTSKFATVIIECSLEMGMLPPLGITFILQEMVPS